MARQKYPHEIPVPKQGQIAIFRNKNDGWRYYKIANGTPEGRIVRMDDELNGETFNIYEKNITSVINYTEDTMEILDTDDGQSKRSGIDLVTVKFCCQTTVVAATGGGGRGRTGPAGPAGGISEFAMFYGLTTGTGNAGPDDYAATIAVKTSAGTGRVPFPRNGPIVGGMAIAVGGTLPPLVAEVTIPNAGTYEVTFVTSVTEAGQLQLEVDGVDLPETVAGRATGTNEIIGNSIITVGAGAKLAVINPTGNAAALTITPSAGGTHAVAQTLTIKRLA